MVRKIEKSRPGELSTIYREFKKEFLLQLTTTNPLRLWLMAFKVVGKKESYVNARLLRFIVVKTQYREKNSCLGHPVYCAQITRSWFFPFSNKLPNSFLGSFKCISDLKVICAQSWGDIEALWAIRSAKLSLQQPPSLVLFEWNTLYMSEVPGTQLGAS